MKIELQEALEENIQPPANVAELAFLYKNTEWYKHLKPSTKKYYDYYILILVKSPYGKKPIDSITPRVAQMIYNSLVKDHGNNIANLLSAVWNRIYKHAVKKEWITASPWDTMEKKRGVARVTTWTEDLVMKVVNEAIRRDNLGVAIGIMLMYDTAQRPSDVLAMTHSMLKSDEEGPYLELFQGKTGTYVRVAITTYTARLVGDGKPWEYLVGKKMGLDVFRQSFRSIAKSVGVNPKLQLRDLRRTALTEAGDGGATDDQLMAQSGHKDRGMLDRYSVKTRQKALDAHRARYANRYERFS